MVRISSLAVHTLLYLLYAAPFSVLLLFAVPAQSDDFTDYRNP